MDEYQKRLLILASPRSGTRYMGKVLCNSGLQIGHEKFRRDGTVGMFLAVEDCYYPGKHWITEDEQRQRRSDYTFDEVWHFTRDPRKVIASIASSIFDKTIWCWQERHTGISSGLYPAKLRSMLFWVAWNDLIEKNEKIDLFFRIEDIDDVWPEICERMGIDFEAGPDSYPRDYGTQEPGKRVTEPMTWDEMKSIDNETYERVFEMAVRYGYEE